VSKSVLSPTERRAWLAFLDAQAALLRHLEADLVAQQHLTLAEFDVLAQLENAPRGRLRMTDLSERVRLSRSGITRLVDRMVESGLVERVSCPSDRRGMFAALTTDGRRRLQQAAPIHLRGVHDYFTGHLSAQQLHAITSALEPVGSGMRGHDPTPDC
jgi:DNA-binding MarR family transcriptional regulator